MKYEAFEAAAREAWQRIPAEYKEGVDGLVIERDALADPAAADIYTLGHCVTESYPSAFGSAETTRSVVILYYGSFLRLSMQDPHFDWNHEVWETLTHELQHHLESLAAEDTLEELDYAVEQNFRRQDGQPFDPLFYRAGQPVAENTFEVDQSVFIEVDRRRMAEDYAVFNWQGATYRVKDPRPEADVSFIEVQEGVCVVVVSERSALRIMGDLIRRKGPLVAESRATAVPVVE